MSENYRSVLNGSYSARCNTVARMCLHYYGSQIFFLLWGNELLFCNKPEILKRSFSFLRTTFVKLDLTSFAGGLIFVKWNEQFLRKPLNREFFTLNDFLCSVLITWPNCDCNVIKPISTVTVFQKGQSQTERYRFLASGGGYAWVLTQATVIYSATQKPHSVVCVNFIIR